ncbi:hypothetical protein [Lentzea sp. E54]|uniref:hypothetical protein n=1 Tax=Lentzea xerophila TaxID=3435883 RepID=UPI003DA2DE00
MAAPNGEDGWCSLCGELYAGGRPAVVIDLCGQRSCLPCLEDVVFMSAVPTVNAVVSNDEWDWGELPAGVTCPFCRGELDRVALERVNVSASVLDIACAVDRSRPYVRYAGQDWQPYEPSPLALILDEVPSLELDHFPSLSRATGFIEHVGAELAAEVRRYRDLIEQMGTRVQALPPPAGWEVDEFLGEADAVTERIAVLCQARELVVDLVTSVAGADPEGMAAACRESFAAMRLVCEKVTTVTADELPPTWELLTQTPCVRIPLPDLRSVAASLGEGTWWFDLAARIEAVNHRVADVWAEVTGTPFLPEAHPVAERRTRARAVLGVLTETDFLGCVEALENKLWYCLLVRHEDAALCGRVALARQVLGIDDAVLPV